MRHTTGFTRRLVAGCLTAALITLAAASPAPAATDTAATSGATTTALTSQKFKVYSWNIAGWAMHKASTTDGIVEAVANSIRGQDVDFAALNEVCHNQLNAIRQNLRDSGWPQDPYNFVRYVEVRSDVCNGNGVGIALISKAPLGTSVRYTLPDDGRLSHRKLLCAPLEAKPHVQFCTTHITTSEEIINGSNIKQQQLDYVRARLDDYYNAGDTPMIVGDFNAQPNKALLDNWYAPSVNTAVNSNNTGLYREIDDTDDVCLGYGEVTFPGSATDGPCGPGVKIDLIFARESQLTYHSGDAMPIATSCTIGKCSDHRIIKGFLTVEFAS